MAETAPAASEGEVDILAAARAYVARCAAGDGKRGGRFPNMAGFCRELGMGVEALRQRMRRQEDEWNALLALFEDEALNSGLSPTIVSAYLKQYHGYGAPHESESHAAMAGEGLKLIFEHDIFEDGG